MRAVVQKVASAAVEVDGAVVSAIGPGLLCLVGLAKTDTPTEIEAMARKIVRLRAFAAGELQQQQQQQQPGAPASSSAATTKPLNPWTASVADVGGEVLLVSQFTLHARTHKRHRPDFSRAMGPGEAAGRWRDFVELVRREAVEAGCKAVNEGRFGQMMRVRLDNDGPVTFLLDTDSVGESSAATTTTTATTATGGAAAAEGGGAAATGGGGGGGGGGRES